MKELHYIKKKRIKIYIIVQKVYNSKYLALYASLM